MKMIKKLNIAFALFLILLISLSFVSAAAISADSNNDSKSINDDSDSIRPDNQDIIVDNSESAQANDQKVISESDEFVSIDNANSSTPNETVLTQNNSVQLQKTTTKATVIKTKNIIGKMGKKVKLYVRVYDKNGKKVNKGTVTFTLKGKSYKVKVKNGLASKTITCPFLGIYGVKVKYNGVSPYKSSSSSFRLGSDLKVKYKYSKSLLVNKGAKQYYRITLTNQYTKKPLKNFKIKFKVKINKNKWKTYTLKSNSKGVVSFSTKNLALGTHNVKICSAYKYIKANYNAKIVVKKINYA